MRITRRDCEGAVDRLAKITGKILVIEYSGAPQRPRLALYQDNPHSVIRLHVRGTSHYNQFVRWVSPRLSTGAFYEWVYAAIAGIELYWHNG